MQCGNGYCSSGYHEGTDLGQACWSGIYAAQSGTVVYAGYNGGYGNYIKIDHGGGVATGYAHISYGGFYVGYGQWVNSGQLIAATGQTGNSFGCHLHFEVYVNGRTVNPGLHGRPRRLAVAAARTPKADDAPARGIRPRSDLIRRSWALRPHPASWSDPRARRTARSTRRAGGRPRPCRPTGRP